jgi:hypothetical protein
MTFSKKLIVLGIYEHVVGGKIGTELVKIVGWDSNSMASVTAQTDNDRVKYWRVLPSWDDEASKGFKTVRGMNQWGIESKVRAGRRFPWLDKDEYLEIRAPASPRSADRRSFLVVPIWFITRRLK